MKKILLSASVIFEIGLTSCNTQKTIYESKKKGKMEISNKEKVVVLLKSIETGAQEPVGYINPNKYIQHNLGVADGLAGLGALL